MKFVATLDDVLLDRDEGITKGELRSALGVSLTNDGRLLVADKQGRKLVEFSGTEYKRFSVANSSGGAATIPGSNFKAIPITFKDMFPCEEPTGFAVRTIVDVRRMVISTETRLVRYKLSELKD